MPLYHHHTQSDVGAHTYTDMLTFTRLPTPVSHDHPSAPSSSASPSMSTKSLSIYTASSGTDTSYSINDGLLPSPLPSPREPSTCSKTAAFFGSPFATMGTPTPAPPPAPSRCATLVPEKPKSESRPARSATADFFASSGLGARPTPPPSIKSSASSRETSPPRLPPLSRFFPSRFTKDRTLAGDEESLEHRKAGSDWETSFKREFLQLAEAAAHSSPPLSSSPKQMKEPALTVFMSPPATEHIRLPDPSVSHLQHSHHKNPIRREAHVMSSTRGSTDSGFEEAILHPPSLSEGTHLKSGSAALTVVRALGEGAFSSVWLATDDSGTLAPPVYLQNGDTGTRRPEMNLRRKSSSWAKKGSDSRMHGIKPHPPAVASVRFAWEESDETNSAEGSVVLDEQDGEGAIAAADASSQAVRSEGRLVAVKMMNRALCDVNERTRISFVREVEVLRHIAHPSIVSYLHSFTTRTHHCLVLEHVGGGELFDLVNSDAQYARVTEPAVRRMWGELCRAVGWMHGVALVHRDIKLENILLTRNIFVTNEPLPPLHTPLIKLTDFGLSRFIDPASPLLSTRCGSETYAAPELVLGAGRQSSESEYDHESGASKVHYDGRQTDAWACGVVLYALATRQLPFDAPPPLPISSVPSRNGSVRSNRSAGSVRVRVTNRRRDMLMRIAQCEYYWPDEFDDDEGYWDSPEGEAEAEESSPAATAHRLASPGLKRVVRRLIERSPARRARMVELWDEPWLREEGAPAPPLCAAGREQTSCAEDPEHDGMLLDEEHIDSVASQELEPLA